MPCLPVLQGSSEKSAVSIAKIGTQQQSIWGIPSMVTPMMGDGGFHRHCWYWLYYLKVILIVVAPVMAKGLNLLSSLDNAADLGASWSGVGSESQLPFRWHSHSFLQCMIWQGSGMATLEDLHMCGIYCYCEDVCPGVGPQTPPSSVCLGTGWQLGTYVPPLL